MELLRNSSLKKQCTKPGTFSGPKWLKKGSGFLILCDFFGQAAIVFCSSPIGGEDQLLELLTTIFFAGSLPMAELSRLCSMEAP